MTKGERLKAAKCRELFPLSLLAIAHRQNAGWNMVVLQRCRLQYSLFRPILPSLHRPLGALGSNPRKRWRLLVRVCTAPTEGLRQASNATSPFSPFTQINDAFLRGMSYNKTV